MPEIIPRLRALFTSGFSLIAVMMARIYFTVRLLPPGHPYLDPRNSRKFGIRHVIAEAANHLILDRKNLDQIVVFVLLLTGVVLLGLQLVILVLSLIFGPALAGPIMMPAGPSMFVTVNPDKDIAFMLLDQVFGVGNGAENFFNSCVASAVLCPNETANPPFPWPFHLALHELFRFYSTGILLIGALVVLYFVVVVVVETATTGSPFGQRFKNLWVPVRIVVAIGLLIPLNYGYNSAQYIVLAAAKYGSSFATNAWIRYNNTLTAEMGAGANPTGERTNLVALPKMADPSIVAQLMSIVHTCAFAYYLEDPTIRKTAGGPVAVPGASQLPDPAGQIGQYQDVNKVKPYFVKSVQDWMTNTQERLPVTAGTTYEQALQFYQRGDLVIRFGRYDDTGALYKEETGKVQPTCGDVRIRITDPRDPATAGTGYLGAVEFQKFMFELIRDMWFNVGRNEDYIDFAGRAYLKAVNTDYKNITPCDMGCDAPNANLPGGCGGAKPNRACEKDDITARWKQNATNTLKTEIGDRLLEIWRTYNEQGLEIEMKPEILEYGWGGAGIWFNTIAQVNGAFTGSISDYPSLDKYPMIMEQVRSLKKKNDVQIDGVTQFQPNVSVDSPIGIEVTDPNAKSIALALYKVHEYWNKDAANSESTEKVVTSGALETAMNTVFGTNGLFSMISENPHIHPLAQLVALGKGLVDAAVRNVAGATFGAALGGMMGGLSMQAGSFVNAASSFMVSTAFLGLTVGVVLFYILPFLPFVYFYFAVASWLKTIFEAMVGAPLWALAHLRLDGEGLPGDAAANGYYLILEIFLRPVLSIVGLIAGLVIFSAQVRVLNFIWMLVTENLGGFNSDPLIGTEEGWSLKRSIVDEFFFTVLYAAIVYMMATASFKLIDRIPDDILRYSGQGVSSFSDINQDPIELQRYAAMGGITVGQTAVGGIRDAAATMGGGIGKAVGDVVKGGGKAGL